MRVLIEYRFVISLTPSGVGALAGLNTWPFPRKNPFLAMIEVGPGSSLIDVSSYWPDTFADESDPDDPTLPRGDTGRISCPGITPG